MAASSLHREQNVATDPSPTSSEIEHSASAERAGAAYAD